MTDWNNPSTSQTHTNELAATKGRDESNAKMDYSADTNIPDGTIRWNAAASRFEMWNASGGTWDVLAATYGINVDRVDGINFPAAAATALTDHNKATHDALNINADTVDGYHAGNTANQVAVSNSSRCDGLNADLLDGQHGAYYNDTPNNTKAVFYQSTAPTGWTQDTTVNDRVLRVVSGAGGGDGGSWTISGLTVDGHALTLSEIPPHNHGGGNHNHDVPGSTGSGSSRWSVERIQRAPSFVVYTEDSGTIISTQGGGAAHSHGLTSSGSWRPSHIDVIACTRNK